MKNSEVLADLHLTSNHLDEYRWEWLDKFTAQPRKRDSSNLLILGDLTENKDSHKGVLVNRLSSYIAKWSKIFQVVTILGGNHDGLTSSKPFFKFLDLIPNVVFITQPTWSEDKILYLPHSRTPIDAWKGFQPKFNHYDYIFMHQSITQANTASGYSLNTALPYNYFKNCKAKVISGDVHVPQEVNNVIYVGAPYHIYYGDTYEGRYMFIEKGKISFKSIDSISKWKLKLTSIEELAKQKIKVNDQVAIEYTLERGEQSEWVSLRDRIRNIIKTKGAVLTSLELLINKQDIKSIDHKRSGVKTGTKLSDQEVVKIFGNLNKLNDTYYKVAIKVMEEAAKNAKT